MDWRILALLSAALSAAAAICEKKSLFNINALEFSVILSVFSFLFSLPFILFFDLAAINSQALVILLVKSIFNAVAFYSVMSALKRLDISGSLPLMDLNPGIVAIFSFLFLKEYLSLFQITGLMLLITGTYIINVKKGVSLLDPFLIFIKSRGHNFILAALTAFTITSVLDKVIVGNYKMSTEAFMFFQHIFNLFLFGTAFLAVRKKNIFMCLSKASKKDYALIALIGVLTIGYRYSQILAVAGGKVALVLAIKRLSVFFACFVGGKLFKETNLLIRIIATIILITGTFLITVML